MKRLIVLLAFIAMAAGIAADTAARAEEGEALSDTSGISTKREVKSAISVWEAYIEAVREGDREKARGYWSEETRRRYPAFDWQMPYFDTAVELASRGDLTMADVAEHEDYIELHIASPSKEFTYYLIREQGGWRLANPIELFTKGWLTRETESFVCHYKEGKGPTTRQCAELDKFYEETCSYLGLTLDRKIDYYRCDSVQEVGTLFGMEPTVGRGHMLNYVIAATQWTSYHEVVHVLQGQMCREHPTSLIMEGAACYFGGTSLISR
jgi:hypothetical protein